jgi:hypothetical protein
MKRPVLMSLLWLFVFSIAIISCKKDEDEPAVTIASVTPTTGFIGDAVTITGSNFKSDAVVKFNGTSANVTTATATSLNVTVPVGATSGAITVITGGQTLTGPDFTVKPTPSITNISPLSGATCSTVTITGTNFSSVAEDNTVKFNGVVASVTSASATQLVVAVPNATTGKITITTNGYTAESEQTFTVLHNAATITFNDTPYTYEDLGVCTFLFQDDFAISTTGAGVEGRPSFMIIILGGKPAAAGDYDIEVYTERPGEEYNTGVTTASITFDEDDRMIVTFDAITVTSRSGKPDATIGGTLTVYQ